uniref:YtxH domain-containing protein n=1 Tax=Nitratidesulfovibrio vulgaris (strain DSM 19637 / Miyazaki F) TaxID=883 RepID=B8DRS9_NITV9
MNENYKYGLYFVGGVALGALGAVMLGRGKFDIRPAMADLLSHGFDLKDKASAYAETVREHMEDIVAEAEHVHKQRKDAAEAAAPEAAAEAAKA